MIWLTAVIAAATVAYVVCTVFLWRATKIAADAATESAGAAKDTAEATKQTAEQNKETAELLAALNRPYMGVSHVAFKSGPDGQNYPSWQIMWDIENFGNLPALAVDASAEFLLSETQIHAAKGPNSAEVFPQSPPIQTISTFEVAPARRGAVNDSVAFIVRIYIKYASSDGHRYDHQADLKLNPGYGTFSVVKSQTTTLNQP